MRDIARAEREGRCDAEYMENAEAFARIALGEPEPAEAAE
jgi:hypothetical protein